MQHVRVTEPFAFYHSGHINRLEHQGPLDVTCVEWVQVSSLLRLIRCAWVNDEQHYYHDVP